jgi:hypothetical protein
VGVGRSKRKAKVEAEVRAALAEFAATVEVRVHAELERSRQTQIVLVDAIRSLQAELDNRDQALAYVLERMNRTIDHSTEAIEAARVERQTLVDAIGELVRALPRPAAPVEVDPRPVVSERLLGGKVFSTPSPVVVADIDLVAEERADEADAAPSEPLEPVEPSENNVETVEAKNGTATRPKDSVEVQCRIEGQWIDGFEVFEIIQDGGLRRYRLRRLSDGVVMPVEYAARDVRRKTEASGPRFLRARSPWSRS